jgi:AcrR family transcriptional regulator
MSTGKSRPRKRRSAIEAQRAILDAAEVRLIASGPQGIRLQEVASDVGIAHPTILHHFGSREGLIDAVVKRALESIQLGLIEAVRSSPPDSKTATYLLDGLFARLTEGNRARTFLWLALGGFVHGVEGLDVQSLSEAVHDLRLSKRAEKGKRPPPFEDTHFIIILAALAMLPLAVLEPQGRSSSTFDAARFRAWLGSLIHTHLSSDATPMTSDGRRAQGPT